MSNTNANFEMTGILFGQEARNRKTPHEKIAMLVAVALAPEQPGQ
jgi:transposase